MKDITAFVENHSKNHGSYIPVHDLARMYKTGSACFSEQLHTSIQAGELHLESDRVYLERVWRQEEYAAEKLSSLLNGPPLPAPVLPDPLRVGGITLTDEQRRAVITCLRNRLTLMLARAGSGKTTSAQAIIQYSGSQHFVLCSPTGKAARNLTDHTGYRAFTVHRTLDAHCFSDFLNVETMEDVDLIIVDEGTMLTIDMLAGLLRAAPENCRIVIIGDRNQLPAVGPGDVIHDLVALGFPIAHLTQNHRQSTAASALRSNVVGFDNIQWRSDLAADDSFRLIYDENESSLMDALASDAVTRYLRGDNVQVLALRCDDVMELNRRIRQRVNPLTDAKRTIKSNDFLFADGDRVILKANDNTRGCNNGEVGILHIHDDESFSVELDDGRCPMWPPFEVSDMLLPAYAITIHRSQGSEYDSVLMYVPRCSGCLLHRNSFYTGVSRAKEQLVLYGNPKAVQFGIRNDPPERKSALVEKTRHLTVPFAG